jgi:NAD(P)-dependent dehydrogenase (short-subunit alcohol dehydrogenase family)
MERVWLITGSSRGLGRALAEAVLAAGDKLVATARKPAQLADLVDRHGDQVRAVALDVTDSGAAGNAIQGAVDAFGRLDVLVNNAGYANLNSIEDMAAEDFREQIETNFFGVVNVTRAALPVFRRQRDGHIIQISSIGGRWATPGLSAYQSAKWAVGGFSEVLAKEVGPLGVKVTVVEPGGMRTDWAGSSMRVGAVQPDYQKAVGAMIQAHSTNADIVRGDPAKVAQAILRVASEKRPPHGEGSCSQRDGKAFDHTPMRERGENCQDARACWVCHASAPLRRRGKPFVRAIGSKNAREKSGLSAARSSAWCRTLAIGCNISVHESSSATQTIGSRAYTRRVSSRSCMRIQSSQESEASAVQMNFRSQVFEQKTFRYREVELCAARPIPQREHTSGVPALNSASARVMPSSINLAPADLPAVALPSHDLRV